MKLPQTSPNDIRRELTSLERAIIEGRHGDATRMLESGEDSPYAIWYAVHGYSYDMVVLVVMAGSCLSSLTMTHELFDFIINEKCIRILSFLIKTTFPAITREYVLGATREDDLFKIKCLFDAGIDDHAEAAIQTARDENLVDMVYYMGNRMGLDTHANWVAEYKAASNPKGFNHRLS